MSGWGDKNTLWDIPLSAGWSALDAQAAAQSNKVLKAAPANAGESLYVSSITFSNGATAGTVKLVEDPAGTPVDKFGPIYLAINSTTAIVFEIPIKLTALKALGYTSVTVTTHSVSVQGFTVTT